MLASKGELLLVEGAPGATVSAELHFRQATGQQVAWARDKELFLKLYRNLIVLRLQ